MYLSQQHAYPNGAGSMGSRPVANVMQWQLGVDHKGDFVCIGPQYQYEAHTNNDVPVSSWATRLAAKAHR